MYDSLKHSQWIQLEGKVPVPKKLTINDGKRIYNQVCSKCHKDGKLGAQIVGDKNAWAPAIKQNLDVLVLNTLSGKGQMPAKGGCSHCSKAEIIAAVKYMVQESKTKGDYSLW